MIFRKRSPNEVGRLFLGRKIAKEEQTAGREKVGRDICGADSNL